MDLVSCKIYVCVFFFFFCDVSSLFNVANMRQVALNNSFQYMRTPMMRRVSGELKSQDPQ